MHIVKLQKKHNSNSQNYTNKITTTDIKKITAMPSKALQTIPTINDLKYGVIS